MEGLKWELKKTVRNKDLTFLATGTFIFFLICMLIVSKNFGAKYFEWINKGGVKNTVEYFLSRLHIVFSLILSSLIIISSKNIYQSEYNYKTYYTIKYSKIGLNKIFTQKAIIQIALLQICVLIFFLILLIYSLFIDYNYQDYVNYATKSNVNSFFEFYLMIFLEVNVNCLIIGFIYFYSKNNKLLINIYYILMIIGVIINYQMPFTLNYHSQSGFKISIFFTSIYLFIIVILIKSKNEGRVSKI